MTKIWSDWERTRASTLDKTWHRALRAAGQPMGANWMIPVVDVASPNVPLDTFRCGPLRLVSPRLQRVIQRASPRHAFEFLPVDVRAQGAEIAGYAALNVLAEHDALDHERSKFTLDDGVVDEIFELVIDEERARGLHLFRLKAWERVLCVSTELAASIEEANCTGVDFLLADDWPGH